mmetsp:Transcript_11165/g.22871  ORF Transcript_11165/g.22871 Transcript_11165/m.22871 type:complete len:207 (+) Transcript_11165:972-1592(+)
MDFLLAPSIGDLGTVAALLLTLGTPNCPPAPTSPVLLGRGRALKGFTGSLDLFSAGYERRGALELKLALTLVFPKLGKPGESKTSSDAALMVFSLMELRLRDRCIFLFSEIPISLCASDLLDALTAFFALSRLRIMLAAVKDELGDWRKVVESWKRTWEVEWGLVPDEVTAAAAASSAAFFSASSFITLALAFLISLVVSGLKSIM